MLTTLGYGPLSEAALYLQSISRRVRPRVSWHPACRSYVKMWSPDQVLLLQPPPPPFQISTASKEYCRVLPPTLDSACVAFQFQPASETQSTLVPVISYLSEALCLSRLRKMNWEERTESSTTHVTIHSQAAFSTHRVSASMNIIAPS